MRNEDRELIISILEDILWGLDQIHKRFLVIETADDFLDTDTGLEKLDSICMQLINIGEAIKKIDKISHKKLLSNYPEIEWKKVMGMRDIISHHYFDIDAEIVYSVCNERIPKLKNAITSIRKNLSK